MPGILGPSIAACGTGAASTGTRADLLICDDIVDVKALFSKVQRHAEAGEPVGRGKIGHRAAWFAFEGTAPMFLIDSNIRAAGKGLLADCAGIIITGRRFPVMNYTNDKDELRKKITTLAVEGERVVLLDNLAGSVGNDVLDAALTSPSWKDRLLGGNRMYEGPST